MGMYTEFHFNSELKSNTPKEIIDALQFMLHENEVKPNIDHPLFNTEQYGIMLIGDSYYFDADTYSTLKFDKIAGTYFLCIRSNFKNYNQEIEKFLDWIKPYLAKRSGDFLGFKRYEEAEVPTLIYFEDVPPPHCHVIGI